MVAMDLVKGLHQQINILKSEVYFLRQEPREKSNLLKIIVKSTFLETVDGFVLEQKQQNSLITAKEKEYCTTDTDDNTSINNHTINSKGSHKNNDNINIKSVKWSKAMKINNDGFKIKDNKNDNYNNLDIKKLSLITSIANTTATSKTITSITKTRGTQSAEIAVASAPIL